MDANRLLAAAAEAMRPEWTQDVPENSIFRRSPEDEVSPVVVAALRELAKGYDEYTEGVIGDELTELANEIEERWVCE